MEVAAGVVVPQAESRLVALIMIKSIVLFMGKSCAAIGKINES